MTIELNNRKKNCSVVIKRTIDKEKYDNTYVTTILKCSYKSHLNNVINTFFCFYTVSNIL